MSTGRHLGFDQPTYRATHDGALAVLSVLSNFVYAGKAEVVFYL